MSTAVLEQTRTIQGHTFPIAYCVLVRRGEQVSWKVLRCPLCGVTGKKAHRHGAGLPGEDPRSYLSHRTQHCQLADLRRLGLVGSVNGYILQEVS